MPELNLTAAVKGTPNTASASGRSAAGAAPEEPDAAAFGAAMAQASSQQSAQGEAAPAEKKAEAAPGARKGKPGDAKAKPAADGKSLPNKKRADTDAATNAANVTPGLEQALALTAPMAAPAALPAALHAAAGDATETGDETDSISTAGRKGAAHPRGVAAAEIKAPPPEGAAAARSAAPAAKEPAKGRPAPRDSAVVADREEGRAQSVKDSPAAPPARSRAPAASDRLTEDFQQRFERALTAASATPARGDASAVHASAAPGLAAAAGAVPAPNNALQVAVAVPVGAAAFGEDFSNRVAWLARGKIHSAELSLTPADLGPVSVSIEVRGTEATLVFGAAHAATRSAIEDALPRLREMLDAQGLQLADARVGTQSERGTARDGGRQSRTPNPLPAAAAIEPVAAAPVATLRSARLIDVIA